MLGRQAFVGVPGFIEHVYDKGTLDDLSNQAENFVVVEVGEGAAQALALHGGLVCASSSACCSSATRTCAHGWNRATATRWHAWTSCWTIRSTSSS
ncbi:hypothetical protein G6F61_014600 [Rhizopus arrhizus]|nr:hypothetical protein G6F61_014600 [Rhizopus arrhizus]